MSSQVEAADSRRVLTIAIGLDATGLDSIRRLIPGVSLAESLAVIVVARRGCVEHPALVEALRSVSPWPVVEAGEKDLLAPATIFLAPPECDLEIRDGRFVVEPMLGSKHGRADYPFDRLFRSLARELGANVAGVVLAGEGSDGIAGLREIRAAGGFAVIARSEHDAVSELVRDAIEIGGVDLVLSASELADAIERFRRLRHDPEVDSRLSGSVTEDLSEDDVAVLAGILRSGSGFDISHYKTGTVCRRLVRRMALLGVEDRAEYLRRLRNCEIERRALIQDLMIGVTDFFRDEVAFETLRRLAIEPAIDAARSGGSIRAWVAGCATGEEAYSIAIELLDAVREGQKELSVQIFATDVDERAVAVGRAGIYPSSIIDHIAPERLEKHFSKLPDGRYRVLPKLRDVVSFAVHDLCSDPPFSRMQIVSCRNALIYLTHAAQDHVLRCLHFALEPGGILFLGPSETIGSRSELFAALSSDWRIYRKVGVSAPLFFPRSASRIRPGSTSASVTPPESRRSPVQGRGIGDLARQALLAGRVPPSVVVGEDGRILFAHGDLSPYLHFPAGEPTFELAPALDVALATRVRAALYKCRREQCTVNVHSSPSPFGQLRTKITVSPAPSVGQGAVIVSFEPVDLGSSDASPRPSERVEERVIYDQLEHELELTRDDLRSTVEALETSNEELRAAHEEAVSMNEELQSANEELEATTEEMRSLNEELSTVNAQLKDKVRQLQRARDDLANFLSSTSIATLFLDDELRLKSFTPAAEILLGLVESDRGRSVSQLARELLQHGLIDEARSVLDTLLPTSRELGTADGRWFVRRVLPYRTQQRRIEGTVVTFVDVTDFRRARERLEEQAGKKAVLARLGLRAVEEDDPLVLMEAIVADIKQSLGADASEVLELQPGGNELLLCASVGWRGVDGAPVAVATGLESHAGYTLSVDAPVIVERLETELRFSDARLLRDQGFVSGIACVIRERGATFGVLGVHTRTTRGFTIEDANFLQAAANILGSAISQARVRLRLALKRGVASVLFESRSFAEAFPKLVDVFARQCGVPVCEYWAVDSDESLLRRSECGRSALVPATRELGASERDTLRRGEGLLGRAWESGAVLRIASSASHEGLPAREIGRHGAVSAVAIPVHRGATVCGALCLLSDERIMGVESLLQTFESIGYSFGEFLRRTDAEQKVRESEERFRLQAAELESVYASLPVGVAIYDRDHSIVKANDTLAAMARGTADRLVGHKLEESLPDLFASAGPVLDKVFEAGEAVHGVEAELTGLDGGHFYWLCSYAPLRDEEGKVVAACCVIQDITERKLVEKALHEADRQKNQFLAMLGHELRNPLAAIRSAAEILQNIESADPRLDRMRCVLERQTLHMIRLIDGLLEVSRIVRGKMRLDREIVDLRRVVLDVLGDHGDQLARASLALRTRVPDSPLWLEGDRVRLAQVIDNVVTNAVRFTPANGTITVDASRDGDALVLSVHDTGIGIERDLLPHIFEPFRQATQNLDRASGGLGLGLALVKGIVELHGGEVAAHSDGRDQGTTITLRFPAANAPEERGDSRGGVRASPKRIVVVEDHRDAAAMLQDALLARGHEIAVAHDASSGLDLARRFRPDAILCDIGLPGGKSGFDFAREARSDDILRGVLLIALTGYGSPEDREAARAAGFDAHAPKPADIDAIESILEARQGR